jgi:BolA protein
LSEVVDRIRERLAVLSPTAIDIQDDSALHAGHAGARAGGGHYRLHIVSTAFEGKSTIARHRLIYATLGDLMKKEIHALAIRAVSASEATK